MNSIERIKGKIRRNFSDSDKTSFAPKRKKRTKIIWGIYQTRNFRRKQRFLFAKSKKSERKQTNKTTVGNNV